MTQSDGPSVNSDISLPSLTEVYSTASLDSSNKSEICAEFAEKEQIIEEMAEDLTLRELTNPRDVMTTSATNLNYLVELDIGTIDKNNATQMNLFLKMTCFDIPNTIPVKRNNLYNLYCASLPTKVMQISHLSVRNLNGILSEDGES